MIGTGANVSVAVRQNTNGNLSEPKAHQAEIGLADINITNVRLAVKQNQRVKIDKRVLRKKQYPLRYYWFAAIGKSALFGSAFGKWLTGTYTPFAMSSARRAFFFASIAAFFFAFVFS